MYFNMLVYLMICLKASEISYFHTVVLGEVRVQYLASLKERCFVVWSRLVIIIFQLHV